MCARSAAAVASTPTRSTTAAGRPPAGSLAGVRPIPDGGSIAVQPEHPYRARLVIDAGAERAGVTARAARRAPPRWR